MNKKFLSAILFGALMVTSAGTFVSCKDYDDDINDLQEQIDKLATKEDMAAKISALESALSTASKSATDALAKAEAAAAAAKVAGDAAAEAKAVADKAAAEAKLAAIAAAKAEVAAAKADLEKLVADGLAENKAELDKMAEKVAKAVQTVEGIVGKIADMVTAVDLLYSVHGQLDHMLKYTSLVFQSTKEKDNTFGPAGEVKFKEGTDVVFTDGVIVRVSPSNAELTPGDISFINSKGEDLSKLVTVTKVERYNELITGPSILSQRSAAQSGLWKISTTLNTTDKKAIEAVAESGDKAVMFAVAVKNQLADNATRQVVSSYDLELALGDYKPLNELYFKVNDTEVGAIANRYESSDAKEYRWIDKAAVKPDYENNINAEDDDLDDRYDDLDSYPYFQTEVGKEFTVSVKEFIDGEYESTAAVKAIYVAFDKDFAEDDSAPSEINAWESYAKDIKGLNTLSYDGTVKMSINAASANGDIIGFRVYAVNYDGTLVDPDGKAFYVAVGKPVETTTFSADWTWKEAGKGEVGLVAVPEGTFTEAMVKAWDVAKIDFDPAAQDTVQYGDRGGFIDDQFAITDYKFFEDAEGEKQVTDLSTWDKVKKIKFVQAVTDPALEAYLFDNNKKYSATLVFANKNGIAQKRMNLTVTKKLPTAFPAAFDFKPGVANNGVVKVIPAVAGPAATYAMDRIFNINSSTLTIGNFTFAQNVAKDPIVTFNGQTSVIAQTKIDSKTEYAIKVTYSYGNIDSNSNTEEVEVTFAKTFKMVFCSEVGISTLNATDLKLTYGKDKNVTLSSLSLKNGSEVYKWHTADKLVAADVNKAYNSFAARNLIIKSIGAIKVKVDGVVVDYYTTAAITVIDTTPAETDVTKKVYDFVIPFTAKSKDIVDFTKVSAKLVLAITDKFGKEIEKEVAIEIVP